MSLDRSLGCVCRTGKIRIEDIGVGLPKRVSPKWQEIKELSQCVFVCTRVCVYACLCVLVLAAVSPEILHCWLKDFTNPV